jgi:uncharacterized repeat protein (TIGR01451 family)
MVLALIVGLGSTASAAPPFDWANKGGFTFGTESSVTNAVVTPGTGVLFLDSTLVTDTHPVLSNPPGSYGTIGWGNQKVPTGPGGGTPNASVVTSDDPFAAIHDTPLGDPACCDNNRSALNITTFSGTGLDPGETVTVATLTHANRPIFQPFLRSVLINSVLRIFNPAAIPALLEESTPVPVRLIETANTPTEAGCDPATHIAGTTPCSDFFDFPLGALSGLTFTDPADCPGLNCGREYRLTFTLALGSGATFDTFVGECDASNPGLEACGRLRTQENATNNISIQMTLEAPLLAVDKTPDGGTFTPGGQASFTIVVSNPGAAGTGVATNVVLQDQLPGNGGLVWTSAVPTVGSCTIGQVPDPANYLRCNLGDIAEGASVTVVVSTDATTPLAACQDQPNPVALATADLGVKAQDEGSLSCAPAAQLQVVKTPDGGSFPSGGQASFTIVVSNPAPAGSQSALNVQLTDALPGNGGLVWTTASTTQGTCVNPIVGNSLSCSLGNIAPGGSVTVTVSTAATTPAAACQSQPNPVAQATADGGLSAQDAGSLTCTPPTTFVTVTQGGWGAPPNGNNPGAFLAAHFAAIGPVVVGGGGCGGAKTLTFTTAAAIEVFLPQGGTPAALTASAVNPTGKISVFAGQVLALQISVSFSNVGLLPPGLGGFVLPSGPAAGQTVAQVLADANKALGGCGLPAYVTSISQLNDIVTSINEMFD